MKKFLAEFKEFAMKGNVIDMAVGLVVGSAFTTIVNSLIGNIVTPALSMITGSVNFSSLSVSIPAPLTGDTITIAYGQFLQDVFSFLIIALTLFLLIKGLNRIRRKKEEAPAAPPEPPKPSKEEVLLTEIRDLLADKKDGESPL